MIQYNLQKLEELLRDFYCLTNIKICIYDNSGNELCYYPEKLTEFCRYLRRDKAMNEQCLQCDRNAFSECKKNKKQYFYTCHAGLLECISPILYDDKIIGYIVVGQIKDPNHAQFDDIAPRLCGCDLQQLEERFNHLPNADIEKIKSAFHILDACTGYEYLKTLVISTENRIDTKMDSFITDNLQNKLSVQMLCRKFRLSHTEIYTIFKESFHSTPAEYIKKRRLMKAEELLKTTDFPIHKIAVLCGLPDYNYFTKVFKKQTGLSPRNYKKSNQFD